MDRRHPCCSRAKCNRNKAKSATTTKQSDVIASQSGYDNGSAKVLYKDRNFREARSDQDLFYDCNTDDENDLPKEGKIKSNVSSKPLTYKPKVKSPAGQSAGQRERKKIRENLEKMAEEMQLLEKGLDAASLESERSRSRSRGRKQQFRMGKPKIFIKPENLSIPLTLQLQVEYQQPGSAVSTSGQSGLSIPMQTEPYQQQLKVKAAVSSVQSQSSKRVCKCASKIKSGALPTERNEYSSDATQSTAKTMPSRSSKSNANELTQMETENVPSASSQPPLNDEASKQSNVSKSHLSSQRTSSQLMKEFSSCNCSSCHLSLSQVVSSASQSKRTINKPLPNIMSQSSTLPQSLTPEMSSNTITAKSKESTAKTAAKAATPEAEIAELTETDDAAETAERVVISVTAGSAKSADTTDIANTAKRVQTADTAELAESTDADDAAETAESTETDDAAETAERVVISVTAGLAKSTDTTDTVNTAKKMQTADTAELAESTERDDEAETLERVATSETANSAKLADSTNTADTAKRVQTADTAELAESTDADDTAETAESTETDDEADMAARVATSETAAVAKSAETTDIADTAKRVQTADIAEFAESTDADDAAEMAKMADMAAKAATSEIAEKTKIADTADKSKLAEPKETDDAAETAERAAKPETSDTAKAAETKKTDDNTEASEKETPKTEQLSTIKELSEILNQTGSTVTISKANTPCTCCKIRSTQKPIEGPCSCGTQPSAIKAEQELSEPEIDNRKKYKLAYPQQKDMKLCAKCRFDPSPLIDDDGVVFCPYHCGCCLCPWQPRRTESQQDEIKHTHIKICKCREHGSIFEDPLQDAKCSQKSLFDICPCHDKAEARFLHLYGKEMWIKGQLQTPPVVDEVALDDVKELFPPKKS